MVQITSSSTAAVKSRNCISRFWGFRCQVNWTFQSPDPRISDDLSPSQLLQIWQLSAFREIWMESNSHWISVFLLLCKLLLHVFSSMLYLLSSYVRIPRGFILHILPSPLLPSMTTTINTHSLLVQYFPTGSLPFESRPLELPLFPSLEAQTCSLSPSVEDFAE